MKKMLLRIMAVFLTAVILSACRAEPYSLHSGMYVPQQISGSQITVPYILINDEKFTVVLNAAVSYQPSGEIERSGNEVILQSDYAGSEYRWVFELKSDNELTFSAERSVIPQNASMWEDRTVFIRTDN